MTAAARALRWAGAAAGRLVWPLAELTGAALVVAAVAMYSTAGAVGLAGAMLILVANLRGRGDRAGTERDA